VKGILCLVPRMSDTALLSLKILSLRLLVLFRRVVFKTKMRISMEHLWCVTDRVARKYYCTLCKTCFTLIFSAINLTCIGLGSNPDLRGYFTSSERTSWGTRYSRAYSPSFIYFLLVREDLLTGCTNAYADILCQ
jgi:hypothetical protein